MATGASDLRADRGVAGSQSTQSTTGASQASSQSSITNPPRSQSVRPVSSYVNSIGWLAGREVGYRVSGRTAPIPASIRALTIY